MNIGPFDVPGSDTTLWRYMRLGHALKGIRNRKLFFARPVAFSDGTECVPTDRERALLAFNLEQDKKKLKASGLLPDRLCPCP